jgi:hypothetical protein
MRYHQHLLEDGEGKDHDVVPAYGERPASHLSREHCRPEAVESWAKPRTPNEGSMQSSPNATAGAHV